MRVLEAHSGAGKFIGIGAMSDDYGIARRGRRRSSLRIWAWAALALVVLAAVASAGGAAYIIQQQQRPPREWVPYLLRRAQNNGALISWPISAAVTLLERADRIPGGATTLPPDWVGARAGVASGSDINPSDTHQRLVGSASALYDAINTAVPGDVIELLPGHYRIEDRGIRIGRPGRKDAPITVRAARLGDAVIESAAVEAIKINVPDWHFENLVMQGVCPPENDSYCEHAFHVVGNAQRIVIRNNLLADFNAQIKINLENGGLPDDGIIEGNTLTDTRPRSTPNPVTPIDLDAASGWRMSRNLISGFTKTGGNDVSYGAFAKAAGTDNVFERNVVLCENRPLGPTGHTIGLSLGGGGAGGAINRDGGRSGLEQDNSRISDNLIAFCSDVGIYLNKAAHSLIDHNTIIDTSGIEVRFPESSAEIEGNIIDGIIQLRDGATIRTESNETASLLGLFLGLHPQRRLFFDVARLDLTWSGSPPLDPKPDPRPDLCGAARGPQPAIGAFENFAVCLDHAGQ